MENPLKTGWLRLYCTLCCYFFFSNSMASVWPSCSFIQTLQLICRAGRLQLHTDWAPCLQAHVKLKTVWYKLWPKAIQWAFVLDSCSLSSWPLECITKTFSSLQQSVKDSGLRKKKKIRLPTQGLENKNFNKCTFQMIVWKIARLEDKVLLPHFHLGN